VFTPQRSLVRVQCRPFRRPLILTGFKQGKHLRASREFCVTCESRFSIAELARFAPRLISQVLPRQSVESECLLQYELSIAFEEMNVGATAGRSLADRRGCRSLACQRASGNSGWHVLELPATGGELMARQNPHPSPTRHPAHFDLGAGCPALGVPPRLSVEFPNSLNKLAVARVRRRLVSSKATGCLGVALSEWPFSFFDRIAGRHGDSLRRDQSGSTGWSWNWERRRSNDDRTRRRIERQNVYESQTSIFAGIFP
jgi:hypothetical protein